MAEQVNLLADDAPVWLPSYVERGLPWGGSTYVHAYTFAEYAQWMFNAKYIAARAAGVSLADPKAPAPAQEDLALWQLISVCRTAPGGGEPTFVVTHMKELESLRRMRQMLPPPWVELACAESDRMCLAGYVPVDDQTAGPEAGSATPWAQMLKDRRFWESLNYLSVVMYKEPLCENRRPMDEVLNVLLRSHDAQQGMLKALAPLVAGAVATKALGG